MDVELQWWCEENLEQHQAAFQAKYGRHQEGIILPWVAVSSLGGTTTVEFSSDSRAKAMEYIAEEQIRESYIDWQGEVEKRFGLSFYVIKEILLRFTLTKDECELLGLEW